MDISSLTLFCHVNRPVPSLFWAAGFAFSSSDVIKDAPYDPSLQFLFFGEEGSMSARLWTNGWDFYAPTKSVVYHLWTRVYRPVFQENETDLKKQQRQHAQARVKQLLQYAGQDGVLTLEPPFALGPTRSLLDYQKHIGVNFNTQEIEWRAQWGNMDPIHFEISRQSSETQTPAIDNE